MSRRAVNRVRGIGVALCLGFVACEAWGATPPSIQHGCVEDTSRSNGSYDLPRLLDVAQCLNPETREAWERARQANFAVDLVRSSYAPQVSLEALGGFQRTPAPIPTNLIPRGYFTSNTRELIPALSVKWLLFDFGRRAGLEATAHANRAAAEVAYTGAQQELIFRVSRAYFDFQSSHEGLRAAGKALEAALMTQDATEAQRRNGRATVVAVAQAERQTALSKLNQVKAKGTARIAYATLIATVGLPADTQLAIGEATGGPVPLLPDETVDQHVQRALAVRPDVRAAEEKVRAAQGEVQSARAAYRPVVSLAGRYYQNIGALSTDGSPYYSVNRPGGAVFLDVELPLFDGGARSAHLSVAQSHVQAAEDQLDQVRDKAAQEVVKAYNDLQTGVEAYSEAQAFAHASRVAYEAALDAYRHGVGTYTDLANDEAMMVQADATLATTTSAARIAQVALALAAGDIRVTP